MMCSSEARDGDGRGPHPHPCSSLKARVQQAVSRLGMRVPEMLRFGFWGCAKHGRHGSIKQQASPELMQAIGLCPDQVTFSAVPEPDSLEGKGGASLPTSPDSGRCRS